MIVPVSVFVAPDRAVLDFSRFLFFIFFIFHLSLKMYEDNHAEFWSDPCYTSSSEEENLNRITHHNRTKRRGDRQRQQEQRNQDFWTWEEILDGRVPWAKPGECRRPKVQREKRQQEQREEVWTWEDELDGKRTLGTAWRISPPQRRAGGGEGREALV